ncbi:MAG: alpha/beta hydrolase [Bryobacteraceae bacterium]
MKSSLFALLLAAAPLAAQQPQDPPFHLPPEVEMTADLVYAKGGGRDLRLDLFRPKSGKGPFPAVVYIHGGGWRGGNKNAFRRQAAHMATIGFAGVCIEYRLSGEAKFPAALHDSKAAVRWVRANAAKYGIDPDRIGAAGGSAGGHLVAMLGTTAHIKELEGDGGNPGHSSRVRAVAAFNPAVDLAGFGKAGSGNATNAVSQFLGMPYGDNPSLWERATPTTHIGNNSAPTLFLHGTGDATVPYAQSVEMAKRLKAAGVHAEIFTAEGAAHGFFNRPPWYEPTLQRMDEFFVKMLR